MELDIPREDLREGAILVVRLDPKNTPAASKPFPCPTCSLSLAAGVAVSPQRVPASYKAMADPLSAPRSGKIFGIFTGKS